VSYYPGRRRQYQKTKVARRQIPLFPSLEISCLNGTSRFDRAASVDITEQLDSDTVLFKLADPGSPTLVQDRDGASALYVLMPMRV